MRTMVDPNSKNDRKLQELMKVKLKLSNHSLLFMQTEGRCTRKEKCENCEGVHNFNGISI